VAGQIHLDPSTMKLWSPLQDLSFGIYNNYSIYQQLSLCFKHVHQVLLTLNSELKNCISCIVYINTSIIDNNWNDWNNINYISNNIISNNCYEKTIDDNINNAYGYRCIDTYSDSSDENSDCEEFTPLLTNCYPITIIGVHGLPLDALVEVEIVSITNNKYELLNFNSIEVYKKYEAEDNNNEIRQLKNSLSYNYIKNSICNGRNEIIINNNNINEMEINIDDIFQLLWNGIKEILSNIDMKIKELKFMKIYYNNDVINKDIISISCDKLLDIIFNITSLNIIFIPIVRLKDDCIITSLFNFSSTNINQDNI
jgi:enamine deaminase RidA (YjgF/YER057c/UK114 family)